MKKALIFLGVFLFLLAPGVVFAESFLGPIVPVEIQEGGPYLQGCDLVKLFDSALKFAVGFATMVATLMFAYAGFLYVTAASKPENLNQAKSVFGNVFTGFIIILIAWLVVDLIMSVFVDEKKIGPWNQISCVERPAQPYYPDSGTIDSSLPGDQTQWTLEDQQRAKLAAAGVQWNNSPCTGGATTGCTNLARTSSDTIDYVIETKKQCDSATGSSCQVVVSGGSEGGHAGGSNPGSHGAGDKVDLRATPDLNSYVDKQITAGTFTKVEDPKFGESQYIDTKTGSVWTYEKGDSGEYDHYDICTSNCAAPAAQGS
ncbi:MAG: pilin [Patescibacteria group bacterium]